MNTERSMAIGRAEERARERAANANEATMENIQRKSFVCKELELYLDTHPECEAAKEYYRRAVAELRDITERYEESGMPITACAAAHGEGWSWTDTPWPWFRGDEMTDGRRDGVNG